MVEDYSRACQRERGKMEEEEKSPEKPLRPDRDLNPQTLSPEPSVLSIRPRRPAGSFQLQLSPIKYDGWSLLQIGFFGKLGGDTS